MVFTTQFGWESQVGYRRVRSLDTGFRSFSFATFPSSISFPFDDGFYWSNRDFAPRLFLHIEGM